jgi:hypothetical protein
VISAPSKSSADSREHLPPHLMPRPTFVSQRRLNNCSPHLKHSPSCSIRTAQSGEQTNQYNRVLPAAVLWHLIAVAEMTPLAASRNLSSVVPASRERRA